MYRPKINNLTPSSRRDQNFIITTTNDADILLFDTTHTGTNNITTPGYNLLNAKSNHNRKSYSDALLSYSDVKGSDAMFTPLDNPLRTSKPKRMLLKFLHHKINSRI